MGVGVGVDVGELVAVDVGVSVGAAVEVDVGIMVGVAVGVLIDSGEGTIPTSTLERTSYIPASI